MRREGFSRHGSKVSVISDVQQNLNPVRMSDSQQSLLLCDSTLSHLLKGTATLMISMLYQKELFEP